MDRATLEKMAREFFTDKAQTGEPSPAFIRDVVDFVEYLYHGQPTTASETTETP